jgi:hypothetical protein
MSETEKPQSDRPPLPPVPPPQPDPRLITHLERSRKNVQEERRS